MDDRLRRLIEQVGTTVPDRATSPATGVAGELAVASSESGNFRRTFLITSRDDRTQTVGVLLVTNEVDMATDLDMIIDAKESGAGYDLMAQGELYGVIFPEQLRNHVGEVAEVVAGDASRALKTDGESLVNYVVGPPLAHPDDPRRSFKEMELRDLQQFTASCRRFLVDGVAEFVSIDPLILLPPPLGTDKLEAQDRLFEVLDAMDELERSQRNSLLNLFDFFSHDQLTEMSRWRTEFGFDLLSKIHNMSIGEVLAPPSEQSADDSRSSLIMAMASHEISAVEIWTLDSETWGGLLVEGTVDGMCRARAVTVRQEQGFVGASR